VAVSLADVVMFIVDANVGITTTDGSPSSAARTSGSPRC